MKSYKESGRRERAGGSSLVAKNLVKLARYSATHFSMNACIVSSGMESNFVEIFLYNSLYYND